MVVVRFEKVPYVLLREVHGDVPHPERGTGGPEDKRKGTMVKNTFITAT
jgi:hypothetical protein